MRRGEEGMASLRLFGPQMAVSITDGILTLTVPPVLSPGPDLGPYCVVNHFFAIRGFVVNRYCLIITRARWPHALLILKQ